ncbi:MAG: hypothetical protein GX434_18360 [Peptococcaceae bacterium]|nr:hypothetical protein [Peptococcaceae bacterium]
MRGIDMQKERVQMESGEDLLSIKIFSRKSLLRSVFLYFSLGLCIFFIIFSFNAFQIYSLPQVLLIFLLIILALCGLKILDMIKWNINGKEVITLSSEKLKIEKRSLIRNNKEYLLEQIKNIRIEPESDSVLRWYTTGEFVTFVTAILTAPEGLIKFDYGRKTIRFAYDIREDEALKIIEEIKKRI